MGCRLYCFDECRSRWHPRWWCPTFRTHRWVVEAQEARITGGMSSIWLSGWLGFSENTRYFRFGCVCSQCGNSWASTKGMWRKVQWWSTFSSVFVTKEHFWILEKFVRDRRAGYQQSLSTLEHANKVQPGLYTKTSLMLGLGETDEEIIQTMKVSHMESKQRCITFLRLDVRLTVFYVGPPCYWCRCCDVWSISKTYREASICCRICEAREIWLLSTSGRGNGFQICRKWSNGSQFL